MTRAATGSMPSIPTRRGHFRLESGHHSDLWMTLETLCSQPSVLQPSIDALTDRLRPYSVDVACGPLNEGAFVALMVTQALGCRFAYAERLVRPASEGLFAVEYRLPVAQRAVVKGKRVAILNDVISAGSAVRGTHEDLIRLDANVVVVGSLLVLGDLFIAFTRERNLRVEAVEQMPYNVSTPGECPLCRGREPLEDLSGPSGRPSSRGGQAGSTRRA